MGSLLKRTFRLYCPDHVDHFWTNLSSVKYIEFYFSISYDDIINVKGAGGHKRYVEGHICLDAETDYHFQRIRSPSRPSRKKQVLQLTQDEGTLVVKFVSDEHLIVRVSRDLVFKGHPRSKSELALEVFEFMGILRDVEREKDEKLERLRKRRGPSPGKTWFERAHPMRYWNQCH
ncbi:hypothetical protein CGCVW01_v012201 [Colletotrichum viniferum]|nr:hypothetical protein CGCVW01_v012201 [Colletotrichum viniferum]